MIQIWYPAASGGPRAAYMAKGVGRIYAAEYRLPGDTFARVRTNAYRNARPLERPGGYPAILFSPGYGVPHALYTSLLEDLASHGFVVIALDHTYETDAVEFPGGGIVRRNLPPDPGRNGGPSSYRLLLRIIGQRVADMRFLRRSLPALDERLGHIIDAQRVGVFGHSLGGLTAANALEADRALRAGVDLDGSIFGPGVRRPLVRPFMIMTGHGDGTLLRFWPRLRRSSPVRPDRRDASPELLRLERARALAAKDGRPPSDSRGDQGSTRAEDRAGLHRCLLRPPPGRGRCSAVGLAFALPRSPPDALSDRAAVARKFERFAASIEMPGGLSWH